MPLPSDASALASRPYALVEQIGRGSFGSVYRGVRVQTGEPVAIKVIDLSGDDDISDVQKEVRMLSLVCGDSPYCVKYHESLVVEHKLWVIMDFCAGGSVRDLLKSGLLDEKHVAVITRQVLLALIYLHSTCKILHRDIKCANVLLGQDTSVKICDFGVSGQITMSSLRRNSFVGSPHWMAREVIQGSAYDFKADIWSLGITVLEMVLGNPPYANQDPRRAILLISRTKPPRLEGNYSPALKEFIALCLQEEPSERPSAEELMRTKFIKNAPKGTQLLAELLARHTEWKRIHGDSVFDPDPLENFADDDEEEDTSWVFDTFKSRNTLSDPPLGTPHTAESIPADSRRGVSPVSDPEEGVPPLKSLGTVTPRILAQTSLDFPSRVDSMLVEVPGQHVDPDQPAGLRPGTSTDSVGSRSTNHSPALLSRQGSGVGTSDSTSTSGIPPLVPEPHSPSTAAPPRPLPIPLAVAPSLVRSFSQPIPSFSPLGPSSSDASSPSPRSNTSPMRSRPVPTFRAGPALSITTAAPASTAIAPTARPPSAVFPDIASLSGPSNAPSHRALLRPGPPRESTAFELATARPQTWAVRASGTGGVVAGGLLGELGSAGISEHAPLVPRALDRQAGSGQSPGVPGALREPADASIPAPGQVRTIVFRKHRRPRHRDAGGQDSGVGRVEGTDGRGTVPPKISMRLKMLSMVVEEMWKG